MKRARTALSLTAISGLVACGGGGSDSPAAPSAAAPYRLSFTPSTLSTTLAHGFSVPMNVTVTADRAIDGVFNVGVIDTVGVITPNLTLAPISQLSYSATVLTSPALPVGTHQGAFQVRLCRDAPTVCASPLPGSPWSLPYSITVLAGPTGLPPVVNPPPAPAPAPVPVTPAPTPAPSAPPPIAQIVGTSLPGLLSMTASGKYTDGSSAGLLAIRTGLFAPAILVNAFATPAAQHRVGFEINDPSPPTGVGPYSDPLSYAPAAATSTALAGFSGRQHILRTAATAGNSNKFRWILDHEFLAANAPRSVTFALWNHIGPDATGFFSGRSAYWGAYVYGVPTAAPTNIGVQPRTYRGVAGMSYLFPDIQSNKFLYGVVQANYVPGTQTLEVTITPSENLQVISGPNNEIAYLSPTTLSGSEPAAFASPISCAATVDVPANTFACSVPLFNLEIRGRFYGSNAEEVGAVFTRYVANGGSTNWGPVGGLVARTQ